ncbi:hypothetical protein [Enterococcus casseliflavus]|uniref:hypothetical protein n=1 Tax=Enterococcus casseliflavus TaxID=37734 RepID=UPI00232F8958|nr:hypothetical protein [Enterococcus casseliflavus]MDB1688344.1 hypothetical protein [Enterococcus casseliflavus]
MIFVAILLTISVLLNVILIIAIRYVNATWNSEAKELKKRENKSMEIFQEFDLVIEKLSKKKVLEEVNCSDHLEELQDFVAICRKTFEFCKNGETTVWVHEISFFADEIEKLVPKRHSIKEQELIVERVIDEKFGNFLDKIAEEEFWNISGRSFK